MAIIKQLNKKNGITYVYDSVSYWDKEKKQPRSKRKLIGKIDPITGDIVPTGKRGGRRPDETDVAQQFIPRVASSEDTDGSEASSTGNLSLPEDKTAEEIWHMYTECRSQLIRTQEALKKSERENDQLQSQKKQIAAQLEQLLYKMNH